MESHSPLYHIQSHLLVQLQNQYPLRNHFRRQTHLHDPFQ